MRMYVCVHSHGHMCAYCRRDSPSSSTCATDLCLCFFLQYVSCCARFWLVSHICSALGVWYRNVLYKYYTFFDRPKIFVPQQLHLYFMRHTDCKKTHPLLQFPYPWQIRAKNTHNNSAPIFDFNYTHIVIVLRKKLFKLNPRGRGNVWVFFLHV